MSIEKQPTHQNPNAPDSGFWLDSQIDTNQRVSVDSRIQRILVWILRILSKLIVSMWVCRPFPESKCSPYYYVVGNPMGFPTLRSVSMSREGT